MEYDYGGGDLGRDLVAASGNEFRERRIGLDRAGRNRGLSDDGGLGLRSVLGSVNFRFLS